MFDKIERNDVLNVAGGFLAAYGFVAFFCFLYLVERWSHGTPTSADPGHAYIYPHNEHGWVTYFSAFQATSCSLLFATSIPLAFVGGFLSPKSNIEYRRGCLSVGAKWDSNDPKKLQRVGGVLGAAAAPIIVFVLGPHLVNALVSAGVVLPF